MRVKMRTSLSGPHYSLQPGEEHDFPDDEAIRLIDRQFAVPVAGQHVEMAVNPPPPEVRAAEPPAAEPVKPANKSPQRKAKGRR